MHSWRLDNLLSAQLNNTKLAEGLNLIRPRPTTGSLASYDEFEFAELVRFRQIFHLEVKDTITGIEPFPGEMMSFKKINVGLPDDIYNILVNYYNAAYDVEFQSIAEAIQRHSDHKIVVRPQINQYGRIQIRSEIFGSANTPRYLKSSFILAKFVQENDLIDMFPGQVQYYFEHEVNLPEEKKTHSLAYVKWFFLVQNPQTRFHCQINDDKKSSI